LTLFQTGLNRSGCSDLTCTCRSGLAAECQSAGYGGVLIPFKCDLTSVDEIQSMFAAIKAQHSGVDVCVNNAGLAHPEPLLSGKTSAWKNMLDVRTVLIRCLFFFETVFVLFCFSCRFCPALHNFK
uniref:Uncharacterized protein n=1 Tax=Xiphophorus couchianus TaxID=32473 RepID=A0A3B5LPE1_9TELE